MKTFLEWVSDYKQPITHNLTRFSSHEEFIGVIQQAIRYLNTNMEEDRVEFDVFGMQVKVWRTRIKGKQRIHVGWKHEWEDNYKETTPDQLAFFLHNYNTSNPSPPDPKGGWFHGHPASPADVARRRHLRL
jgi:hypothetical protein